MKCGILTFHRAINYGGVLQALALQKTIEKMGADAEIIDYYCPAIEGLYRPDLKSRMKKSNLKRYASAILRNGILSFNNKGFSEFRETFLKTSKTAYYNVSQLKAADYDVFITGSDQVWSPYCAGFDRTYFLDFVEDGKRKNAYAASFGVDEIPARMHGEYAKLLADFNHISVREADGADIIKNLSGREVPVVLDPIFLLDACQWSELIDLQDAAGEKYILLYMIAEDQELIHKAISLSKQTGLKVYYINDRLYRKKGVINLRKVSPTKWVELFGAAEYVFTNSFHGVAFSINFGKKFFVQKLKTNTRVNSRINNVLTLFGLEERCDFDRVTEEIDHEAISRLLMREREKSRRFLNDILTGEK